jgi:hypothetical protein
MADSDAGRLIIDLTESDTESSVFGEEIPPLSPSYPSTPEAASTPANRDAVGEGREPDRPRLFHPKRLFDLTREFVIDGCQEADHSPPPPPRVVSPQPQYEYGCFLGLGFYEPVSSPEPAPLIAEDVVVIEPVDLSHRREVGVPPPLRPQRARRGRPRRPVREVQTPLNLNPPPTLEGVARRYSRLPVDRGIRALGELTRVRRRALRALAALTRAEAEVEQLRASGAFDV